MSYIIKGTRTIKTKFHRSDLKMELRIDGHPHPDGNADCGISLIVKYDDPGLLILEKRYMDTKHTLGVQSDYMNEIRESFHILLPKEFDTEKSLRAYYVAMVAEVFSTNIKQPVAALVNSFKTTAFIESVIALNLNK